LWRPFLLPLHLTQQSHVMSKEIRIAINGFGRIGRTVTRVLKNYPEIKLIAVNDLASPATLAHLLKYDTVHGRFGFSIETANDGVLINGALVKFFQEKDPSNLPWKELGIDLVIESTGFFKTTALAQKHIDAGAKKVIITAPAEDDTKSIVLGVNDQILTENDTIISNASCTTNNAAPMIKILQDNWGIESAYITTVHSYTTDQKLHDAPHRDLRRARAAAQNIVPTTTGAAKAITKIFPELDGKIGGAGIRVPVPDGSLTDISCILNKPATIDEINAQFELASKNELSGVLEFTTDPIVSIDVVGNSNSCVFDAQLTSVLGRMVKVVGWYDNEFGYSNRLVELIKRMN
jgi:glyceraldehyde 3-phosphate dehydrogenase